MRHVLYIGDSRKVMRKIKTESINCVVTSPPYFQKRDYKVDGQIGLEKTAEEYIKEIMLVMKEVYRVLRRDGCFFLNVGDSTYNKNLCLIPERLLLSLQDYGFIVRNKIVWVKTNHLPHPVTDRFVFAYEFIYLLVKSKRYYFDLEPLKKPWRESTIKRVLRFIEKEEKYEREKHKTINGCQSPMKILENITTRVGKSLESSGDSNEDIGCLILKNIRKDKERNKKNKYKSYYERVKEIGCKDIKEITPFIRNPSDVWLIQTACHKSHLAPFPKELVRNCLLVSTRENDTVLDPFVGSGTTMEVAEELNRNSIGIDIDPKTKEYVIERMKKFKNQKRLKDNYSFSLEVRTS